MGKNVSASAEAVREISREKARIFRKETATTSLLEKAALAWEKKKGMEERQEQKEKLKKEVSEGPSFREAVAKEVVEHDKQKLSDETGWVQYSPWKKEEKDEKKEIPLNTATVVAIRKKLMAIEWARALGKPRQNNQFHDLERKAGMWKEKKEEKKRREEEIRMRIEGYKKVLYEALEEFGKKLREKKDAVDPEALSTLLEESLGNAGEIFDIEWQKSRCLIWIEPWEEKKLRRISGFEIPGIYRVEINDNFQISAFEKVEDGEAIEGLREELLTRPLKESLEGISFNIENEDEAKEFLEDKLSDIGRLINLERTESGWIAAIEPWEEMRMRNMKRGGSPPVVTDEIQISWKDGKLEFETQNKKGGKKDE